MATIVSSEQNSSYEHPRQGTARVDVIAVPVGRHVELAIPDGNAEGERLLYMARPKTGECTSPYAVAFETDHCAHYLSCAIRIALTHCFTSLVTVI
jgi:hypothetical protein